MQALCKLFNPSSLFSKFLGKDAREGPPAALPLFAARDHCMPPRGRQATAPPRDARYFVEVDAEPCYAGRQFRPVSKALWHTPN